MPYCGNNWVTPGTVCPNGQPATATKGGTEAPPTSPTTPVTGNSGYAWNQDTTPVKVGSKQVGKQNFKPGTGEILKLDTVANEMPVADAREMFNEIRGKGTVKGAGKEDRQEWNNLLGALRQYTGSELGTRGSQESAWADVLKDASRAGVDVYDLLSGRAAAGSGPGSRSGSGGPRTTSSASVTDATTAEALLNKVATDLIGRNLTATEIKKYTQQFNAMERQNPAVSVSDGSGSSVTTSAPDKNELLRQVVSKNPDYMKYQVDSTVMDMFLDRIKEGQAVANG